MVYDYAEPTRFFPVEGTHTLNSMVDYVRYDGKLADICFPTLTAEQVKTGASFVWNDGLIAPDQGQH
jgi:hypothetical protein